MKHLGEFLIKHTHRAEEKKEQTSFVQGVFKKHNITITAKDFSYKNNTLFITTTPLKKGEIMSQRNTLLKELKLSLKGIQEIR